MQNNNQSSKELARIDIYTWKRIDVDNLSVSSSSSFPTATPCGVDSTNENSHGTQLVHISPTQLVTYRDVFSESLVLFQNTDNRSFGVLQLEWRQLPPIMCFVQTQTPAALALLRPQMPPNLRQVTKYMLACFVSFVTRTNSVAKVEATFVRQTLTPRRHRELSTSLHACASQAITISQRVGQNQHKELARNARDRSTAQTFSESVI